MSRPPRVVLDTNLVLSALVFAQGRLAVLRRAWQDGRCVPLVSKAATTELIRVLAYPEFKLSDEEQQELLADYLPWCATVRIPNPPPVTPGCRDPFDQPLLQLAVAGKADYLVSGDQDLPSLCDGFAPDHAARPGDPGHAGCGCCGACSFHCRLSRDGKGDRSAWLQARSLARGPICRWMLQGVALDLMPSQPGILGFHNRWYPLAIESAAQIKLPNGMDIRLITAPVFVVHAGLKITEEGEFLRWNGRKKTYEGMASPLAQACPE